MEEAEGLIAGALQPMGKTGALKLDFEMDTTQHSYLGAPKGKYQIALEVRVHGLLAVCVDTEGSALYSPHSSSGVCWTCTTRKANL